MPTGLIIAINASALMERSEALSTAQHLRPATFTRSHLLNGASLVAINRGTELRPAHFAEAHAFGSPRIEGLELQFLRPATFTNPHTLNGASLDQGAAPEWLDMWVGEGGGDEALAGFADRSFRMRIPAAALLNIGTKVRVTFKAGGDQMTIGEAFIGIAASSGDDYDYATPPTPLTFGGYPDVVIAAGATEVSDELEFPVTGDDDLLISFYNVDSNQPFFFFPDDNAGAFGWYSRGHVDDAGTDDASNYGFSEVPFAVYGILKAEVFGIADSAPGGEILDPLGDLVLFQFAFESDIPGDLALAPLSWTVGGNLTRVDEGPPGNNVLAFQSGVSFPEVRLPSDASQDSAFYLTDQDWTLEGFFKITTPSGYTDELFALKGNESFFVRRSFKFYFENGKPSLYVEGSSAEVTLQAASAIAASQYVHVAWTRTGSTLRIFVDGVLVDSDTFTESINIPSSVESRQAVRNSAAGQLIDDLRFTKGYSRYRSDTTFTPPARPLKPPFSPSGERFTHRLWKVLVLDNNGSGFTSIGSKLAMFESSDGSGTNVITGGSLAGSAGGVFGNVLANLVDNNDSTQWAVSETGNDWVTYNLAAPLQLHSIKMKVIGGQEALMPSHFKIQYSDDGGLSYTTALEVTGENWLSGATERTYSF